MEDSMPMPAMAQTPEEMPEIHRELAMLRGAFTSLESRTREMLEKVKPVVRSVDPRPSEVEMKIAEDHFQVRTSIGTVLRELTQEVSRLEDDVAGVIFRIEL